jgi:hypothetical protein
MVGVSGFTDILAVCAGVIQWVYEWSRGSNVGRLWQGEAWRFRRAGRLWQGEALRFRRSWWGNTWGFSFDQEKGLQSAGCRVISHERAGVASSKGPSTGGIVCCVSVRIAEKRRGVFHPLCARE